MDANAILSKLTRIAPEAILEKGQLGDPGLPLLWVDVKAVRRLAQGARTDSALAADWLENFSVAQIDKALIATWFFRSTAKGPCFALRSTVEPHGPEDWIALPTMRDLWPMAEPFENDAAELYGIRFIDASGAALPVRACLVPESLREVVRGFPLRKDFDVASVPREILQGGLDP